MKWQEAKIKKMIDNKTVNNLINIMGRVKDLRRSGWLKRQVPKPESDGDHMFSTAFLVLLLAPKYAVNKTHCLELALTHDLQEIISGDPVPGEKTLLDKYETELQAITEISQQLEMPCLIDWFKEFEAKQTPEAQFVKSLDRLDTVLTAAYYDRTRHSEPKVWEEFSSYALNCLEDNPSDVAKEACQIIQNIKI